MYRVGDFLPEIVCAADTSIDSGEEALS